MLIAFAHEGNSESRQAVDKTGVGLDDFMTKDIFFAGIFIVRVKAVEANRDAHMTPAQGQAKGVGNDDA